MVESMVEKTVGMTADKTVDTMGSDWVAYSVALKADWTVAKMAVLTADQLVDVTVYLTDEKMVESLAASKAAVLADHWVCPPAEQKDDLLGQCLVVEMDSLQAAWWVIVWVAATGDSMAVPMAERMAALSAWKQNNVCQYSIRYLITYVSIV